VTTDANRKRLGNWSGANGGLPPIMVADPEPRYPILSLGHTVHLDSNESGVIPLTREPDVQDGHFG
jgi:hypothetical protein